MEKWAQNKDQMNTLVTQFKAIRKFKAIIQTLHSKDEEIKIHKEEKRELRFDPSHSNPNASASNTCGHHHSH